VLFCVIDSMVSGLTEEKMRCFTAFSDMRKWRVEKLWLFLQSVGVEFDEYLGGTCVVGGAGNEEEVECIEGGGGS